VAGRAAGPPAAAAVREIIIRGFPLLIVRDSARGLTRATLQRKHSIVFTRRKKDAIHFVQKGRALAASAESRAGLDQAEAERLVVSGMKELGLTAKDLDRLAGSDRRKVAMAQAIHAVTSASQIWMAERLKMKSAANVSQQLRRLKRGELKLDREAKGWLARTVS
jgi:hypothetical protein